MAALLQDLLGGGPSYAPAASGDNEGCEISTVYGNDMETYFCLGQA